MIPTRSKIQDQYAIESDSVYRFLDTHLELSDLLLEAAEQIQAYFPDSQRYLEVDIDPETTEVKLLLSIEPQFDFDEAVNRLEQFEQDWWLDNFNRAESRLTIILAYL